MSLTRSLRRSLHYLRNPGPVLRHEPTQEQKKEITDVIRKQRFYGDLPGRRQYQD
jgi:hypothetical protein